MTSITAQGGVRFRDLALYRQGYSCVAPRAPPGSLQTRTEFPDRGDAATGQRQALGVDRHESHRLPGYAGQSPPVGHSQYGQQYHLGHQSSPASWYPHGVVLLAIRVACPVTVVNLALDVVPLATLVGI